MQVGDRLDLFRAFFPAEAAVQVGSYAHPTCRKYVSASAFVEARRASQRSLVASLAPRATKAPANVRRIQVSTRGREMTWSRTAAANLP